MDGSDRDGRIDLMMDASKHLDPSTKHVIYTYYYAETFSADEERQN